MAVKFVAASPYNSVTPNLAHLEGLFHHLVEDPDKCIFVTEGGFICGLLSPLFFAPEVVIATELAWWAEDGTGEALKSSFEDWAKHMGVSAAQFSTLNNQFAPQMAARLTEDGYTPVEVGYMKVI